MSGRETPNNPCQATPRPGTGVTSPLKAHLSEPRGEEGNNCIQKPGRNMAYPQKLLEVLVHGNRNIKSREKKFHIQRKNGGNKLALRKNRLGPGATIYR